jgi:hypothetical protein
MSDPLGNFQQDSLDELIGKMRRYGDEGDSRYRTLKAELDRRVAKEQINAARAQVRSAWWQVLMVLAMYLTVAATLIAPSAASWLARISN